MIDATSEIGMTGSKRALMVLRSIRTIPDEAGQAALISSLVSTAKPAIVSFVNAHALNLAWDDPVIAANLSGSDVLLRDGIGISLLMRLLDMPRGLNMNGTDFIPRLLAAFPGRKIALCGTAEPFLAAASEHVRKQGGNVVLALDGFRDAGAYPGLIAASGAELVILGMGMPKQELVATAIAAATGQGTLIVNGGAILDFWANRFPRAPAWIRTLRLEWLFRLIQEPERLWRRYLLGGVTFAWRSKILHSALRRG